jgi:peroxiredoxin
MQFSEYAAPVDAFIFPYLFILLSYQNRIFSKIFNMKLGLLYIITLFVSLNFFQHFPLAEEHPTLAIGATAPDFKLQGVDGKIYSLASFSKANILVVVFTCNHCPTAQAYEDRIIQLTSNYSSKGVQVVAISPNNPKAIRLDELDYSDLSDSFEEMKLRAKQKKYNFPYLYDGDKQTTANAYGPVATPHVFIFDRQRKLRFQGRIDNVESPAKTPDQQDTRNAIEALLANKTVNVTTTKVFGCSVKWIEKINTQKIAYEAWAKEPVSLDTINEGGIKDLLKNSSDKLRLINVWATWCGPCVTEFPDFITINRMYRKRDFEFISISADNPSNIKKVTKFLQQQQASCKNYLFSENDKYKLIEAVDPNWQGALPYTILVEPSGKIIYGKQGTIEPAAIKKMIVDHPLIGRYFKQ